MVKVDKIYGLSPGRQIMDGIPYRNEMSRRLTFCSVKSNWEKGATGSSSLIPILDSK